MYPVNKGNALVCTLPALLVSITSTSILEKFPLSLKRAIHFPDLRIDYVPDSDDNHTDDDDGPDEVPFDLFYSLDASLLDEPTEDAGADQEMKIGTMRREVAQKKLEQWIGKLPMRLQQKAMWDSDSLWAALKKFSFDGACTLQISNDSGSFLLRGLQSRLKSFQVVDIARMRDIETQKNHLTRGGLLAHQMVRSDLSRIESDLTLILGFRQNDNDPWEYCRWRPGQGKAKGSKTKDDFSCSLEEFSASM